MTQKDLSDATDGTVSEAWIAALEKNRLKMPPNLDKLKALAAPLGVTYSYLLMPMELAPLSDAKSANWRELLWASDQVDDEGKQFIDQAATLQIEASKRRAREAGKAEQPPKRRAS